ncbi:MAG: XRE family transcriptional regulator [Gammaproteobacteria bacterium]|nr:XRE family transcriptional regulator [Gammaproteobacteria bacterium]
MRKKIPVTVGSTNVYADLGYDKPDEALAKAQLAARIGEILEIRKLTQSAAAELLGIDQPKISALIRGRLRGFSYERLLKFLTDLGCDVEIVVTRPKTRQRSRGEVLVKVA